MTIEREQDIKFTEGLFRETVRLPLGPERESPEMKRDREMEKEEGEVFTLNDWDGPGKRRKRGRQRCYKRRDKWRTIDVSYDVGENPMRGWREGLRPDTKLTSLKKKSSV